MQQYLEKAEARRLASKARRRTAQNEKKKCKIEEQERLIQVKSRFPVLSIMKRKSHEWAKFAEALTAEALTACNQGHAKLETSEWYQSSSSVTPVAAAEESAEAESALAKAAAESALAKAAAESDELCYAANAEELHAQADDASGAQADAKASLSIGGYGITRIIAPQQVGSDKEPAISKLKRIAEFMSQRKDRVAEELDRRLNKKKPDLSVRRINGQRYEILMTSPSTGKKKTRRDRQKNTAIDWVIRESEKHTNLVSSLSGAEVREIRKMIIAYADRQASKALKASGEDSTAYSFGNYGLIVSYGDVHAQDAHIDISAPTHYQFGVMCCDDAHGTSEFGPIEPVLARKALLSTVWQDMPDGLAEKLSAGAEERCLLDSWGGLLSSLKQVNEDTEANKLPIGTLLSLPGGVAHAGPTSTGFRAVLFFTGTPIREQPYNINIQFSRTTLIGTLLMWSWTRLNACERQYMLLQWWKRGLSLDKFGMTNMRHKHLIAIGNAIKEQESEDQRASIIEKIAFDPVWDEEGDAQQRHDSWSNPSKFVYVVPT